MALTHKPGGIGTGGKVSEYPPVLFPSLPVSLLERLPDMVGWEAAAAENYHTLVDVLVRLEKSLTVPVATPATVGAGRDGKDGKDGKDGTNGKDGKDGTNGGIGLTGPAGSSAHAALSYAPVINIDFAAADYRSLALAGDVVFVAGNMAAPRSVTVRIIGDGSARTFAFPAGWTCVGGAAPTGIAAGKVGILTMTCFGSTAADVVYAYAVQV